jgi:hypothetical protein
MLVLPTIYSEMQTRRVKWLQQMTRTPNQSAATLAVLQDAFLWEFDAPIAAHSGLLHPEANPWTKQIYGDLSRLAQIDRKFEKAWRAQHWW